MLYDQTIQVSALSPVVEGINKTSRLPTSSSSNILAQFRSWKNDAMLCVMWGIILNYFYTFC